MDIITILRKGRDVAAQKFCQTAKKTHYEIFALFARDVVVTKKAT